MTTEQKVAPDTKNPTDKVLLVAVIAAATSLGILVIGLHQSNMSALEITTDAIKFSTEQIDERISMTSEQINRNADGLETTRKLINETRDLIHKNATAISSKISVDKIQDNRIKVLEKNPVNKLGYPYIIK